jgi:hypothetical protein
MANVDTSRLLISTCQSPMAGGGALDVIGGQCQHWWSPVALEKRRGETSPLPVTPKVSPATIEN